MKSKKECFKFIIKITAVHVLTYMICGIMAMFLFNYSSSISELGMRDTHSLIVGLAPLFQIIRGCLFGLVFWLIKDTWMSRKNGWIIMWLLILILGVFNTPATSPGSIEYFIYYEIAPGTWMIELKGMIEILIQTFLFSILSFHFSKPRIK